MHCNILVAYASRYQSTKEIAEFIGRQLASQEEFKVSVVAAEEVESLAPYQAVLVGSAIYGEDWLHSASDLVIKHERELAHKDLWLFSTGYVEEGVEPTWDVPASLKNVVERLKPKDNVTFAGRFDSDRMELDDWCMQRDLRDKHLDLRNWDRIEKWCAMVSDKLKASLG
jgi:menaquinone-dependent protoporphyrinogen oxidase